MLDAPTASPFTMESVGGNFGQAASDERVEAVHDANVVGTTRSRRQDGDGIGADREEAAERGEISGEGAAKMRTGFKSPDHDGEAIAGDPFELQDIVSSSK